MHVGTEFEITSREWPARTNALRAWLCFWKTGRPKTSRQLGCSRWGPAQKPTIRYEGGLCDRKDRDREKRVRDDSQCWDSAYKAPLCMLRGSRSPGRPRGQGRRAQ